MNKILALNFGSTSSKIAYFEDDVMVIKETIQHPIEELSQFKDIFDQEEYRVATISDFMKKHKIEQETIDVFVCWGGHCKPVLGGVYRINDQFLSQVKSTKYGRHPGDLTPFVTKKLAGNKLALTVDPPTIDEFSNLAKYTGIKEIKRKSLMQTLNQKAVSKKYAQDIHKTYEELNLIVCHMGGGISVVAHQKGRMVDANNGLDGDGPLASNRAGSVPAGDLVDMCFSGQYSHDEMRKLLTGKGGLVNLLGESDTRNVEKKIALKDTYAKEVYDAMIYQIAKQIGATSAIFKGQVDAILLTGGMANSEYVVQQIKEYVSYVAPIFVYPGELEMESLGQNAYRVLRGIEEIKEVGDDSDV